MCLPATVLMVDKFLSFIFFFAPIFYLTKMSLVKSETIFFELSVAMLFILSCFDKPKREVNLNLFLYLLALAIFQLIVYNFSPTSATCVKNIFIGSVGISIIARYSDGLNRNMLGMIVLAGCINIVITIIQNLGYNPIIENVHNNNGSNLINGGMMGNAPRLGNYLALTVPLAFSYSCFAGALWLIAGLYIGQYPVFLVGFITVLIFELQATNLRHRKAFLIPVIFLFIVFILLEHAHILQSLSVRLTQWQPIFDQIFQHPILGLGLGTYPIFMNNYNEVAMSSLIEFLFNFGFIGGGVILYFFIRDFITNFRVTLISTSLIGLGVLSIFEYPFETPRFWPLIIAMSGFYLIERTGELNGKTYNQG